jgi:hypothetical protein
VSEITYKKFGRAIILIRDLFGVKAQISIDFEGKKILSLPFERFSANFLAQIPSR